MRDGAGRAARVDGGTPLAFLADAPVLMLAPERLLLYSLVVALRPRRVLEIGTHRGGSAMIITAALDEVGSGALVCVDPAPVIEPVHWRQIAHRATLLTGPSPDVLGQARAGAAAPFDFALIDGDHACAGVMRDVEGVLPIVADGAYLLFHDAHFPEVAAAIERELAAHPGRLIDCGMLSVERSVDSDDTVWGGLRLLRHRTPAARAASAPASGAPRALAALAEVIAETTDLDAAAALDAARGLIGPGVYGIDYAAEVRSLWRQGDEAFVHGLYRLLLGRDGDREGARSHLLRLAGGASRVDVVREFVYSSEAAARRVPTDWVSALASAAPPTITGGPGPAAAARPRLARLLARPGLLGKALRFALRTLYLPVNAESAYHASMGQREELARQGKELRALRDALAKVVVRVEALAADRDRR